MQFVDEALSAIPRRLQLPAGGYYQLKDRIALPQANAEGSRSSTSSTARQSGGSPGLAPCRSGSSPARVPEQADRDRRSRSTPSTGLLAYYQRLLSDATDDVAFVKQAQVPGLTESGYVFTTLEGQGEPYLCHRES